MAKGSWTAVLLSFPLAAGWVAAYGHKDLISEQTWSDWMNKFRQEVRQENGESDERDWEFSLDDPKSDSKDENDTSIEQNEKSTRSQKNAKSNKNKDESEDDSWWSGDAPTADKNSSRPTRSGSKGSPPEKKNNSNSRRTKEVPRDKGAVEADFTERSEKPVARDDWQRTIQRIITAGGTDYRIEPGSQSDSVLFLCHVADADPRVTHRFEAEAHDPASAARDVLSQLEEWRSRETASTAKRGQSGTRALGLKGN